MDEKTALKTGNATRMASTASQEETTAPMSNTKRQQLIWPDPLVINPTATHTHSIILLHGLGSNAERFGPELLKATTSSSATSTTDCDDSKAGTLTDHFPTVKFIFPTAKKRRATVFKRMPINQWFDNFSLQDPSKRQDLQYDGLKETSAFVHKLIADEAKLVGGASRVVIGGLSMGCAAASHVLLNFQNDGKEGEREALGGFVGMSGWLPFAEVLDPRKGGGEKGEGEEEDLFGAGGDEDVSLDNLQLQAANTARDIACLPLLAAEDVALFPRTPIFLGHGRNDEKVSVNLGKQARDVFQALGCQVRWEEYDEGHWYKIPEEIDNIVDFLRNVVGIEKGV